MSDFKIFKFTGYIITPNDVEKDDVLDAIDCIGSRLDGMIKNPRIDEREIPDWEIGNDNHPLNYSDAPIELCEQYFEQQKIAELEENEIRAEY